MPTILLEKRPDGVALVTLNRPDSLNSMGEDLLPLLGEVLADCEADAEVRCVAITGAGRAFCAGGDVKSFATGPAEGDGQPELGLDDQIQGLYGQELATSLRLYTMPKPTVALINGAAAGGGMSIALACDIRICSDKARFITAYRNVAVSGDFGICYMLPRLVGSGRARELLFRSEPIDAQRALELGIANRVLAHDALMTDGLAYCAELAAGPTATLGRMKANLAVADSSTFAELLRQEAVTFTLSRQGADHHEAARAFVEKRAADFHGR